MSAWFVWFLIFMSGFACCGWRIIPSVVISVSIFYLILTYELYIIFSYRKASNQNEQFTRTISRLAPFFSGIFENPPYLLYALSWADLCIYQLYHLCLLMVWRCWILFREKIITSIIENCLLHRYQDIQHQQYHQIQSFFQVIILQKMIMLIVTNYL